MFVQTVLIVTLIKILFIPLYYSTDFEVHRNWLAVTHSLPPSEWYYNADSEWTLDYPPFFAWLEYGLSHIAKYFDPEMLVIENLNYKSEMTVIFQRLSVIVLDILYIIGAKSCSDLVIDRELLVFFLLLCNPGLLMVDHIHFQYNGFLYGMMLLSITHMIKGNYIQSSFWFAVLLNFKHIFLYVVPVYVIYLLRAYCFTIPYSDDAKVAWYSFSALNLIKVALTVILVFAASFGPFIHHLPQLLSRLFPFKRGLTHAYWAPNFWAIYNFGDKVLSYIFERFEYIAPTMQGTMTGGLVQEYQHSVFPSINPVKTFLLTAIAMLPALKKLWYLCADRNYRGVNFVRCLILCATCSYMFGWHVHEKAILMILIPLSFMSVLGDVDARMFLILSVVGHYSLFPLLYPTNLIGVKVFLFLTHVAVVFYYIPKLYEPKSKNKKASNTSLLYVIESLYLYGLLNLFLYENVVHSLLGLHKVLPFLPLMFTSGYCALGVIYFWISYYYYYLTFNLSRGILRRKES